MSLVIKKWAKVYNGGTYTVSLWRLPAVLDTGEKVHVVSGWESRKCCLVERKLIQLFGFSAYAADEKEVDALETIPSRRIHDVYKYFFTSEELKKIFEG